MNKNLYLENWKKIEDKKIIKKINLLTNEQIINNFSSHLSFGTAGLRGKMELGINGINEVTVCKLATAVAKYFEKNNLKKVVIGFDTRHNSKKFSRIFAKILSSYGAEVILFKNFVPTPVLTFAISNVKADMGIMITASHNNKIYNGIKVSGSDGIQISGQVEKDLGNLYLEVDEVQAYNNFIKNKVKNNNIEYASNQIVKDFLGSFERKQENNNLNIIYTPLNGTACKYVLKVLKESGFNNVLVPSKQKNPNGDFDTCPNPNPEYADVYEECLNLTKKFDADLIVATDPDGDRLGVMIKTRKGYKLLTGNEVGFLLLNSIYNTKKDKENLYAVSTVVSSPLFFKMCDELNIKSKKTLTGFKNLGKAKKEFEKEYSKDGFVLAYEESCGYVVKNFLYDKDGIFALLKVCELASTLKNNNSSLEEYLDSIYKKYGYMYSLSSNIVFKGNNPTKEMNNTIENLRLNKPQSVYGEKIVKSIDYFLDDTGLEKSNFIEYLTNGFSFIIRPSGTEPKLKFYIHTTGKDIDDAKKTAYGVLESIKKEILSISE